MRIALIPISAKPLHAGHFGLIQLAARENDEVHLYVSLSDRKRPGEFPIYGEDMALIWHEAIESALPPNVGVRYGGSPIGNVWKEMGEASDNDSNDVYVIYSDPEDIRTNFPEALINKYAGKLNEKGNVMLRPVARTETVNVSGTAMRKHLADNDKESFVKLLPKEIDSDFVWRTLRARAAEVPKAPKKRAAASKKASR